MAPDRRDRPQFGLLHASDLAPVVFNGEIEIGLTRHHGRVGGDRTQCFIEVAASKLVGADVGVLSPQPHPKAAISAANKRTAGTIAYAIVAKALPICGRARSSFCINPA